MVFATWHSVLLSFCSGLVLLALSLQVYRRRQAIGYEFFWILLFLFALICLIFGINNLGIFFPELGPYPLSLPLYWVYYSSFYAIPAIWLPYCLKYTGRSDLISGKSILLLSLIPVMMSLLRFHQFWGILPDSLFPPPGDILFKPVLAAGHLYLYGLIFIGIGLLLLQFRTVSDNVRYQTVFLVTGVLIPIVHEFLSEGNLLTSGLDIAVTGFFLAFGILYFDMLLYTPVFREYFFEIIDTGLMVLNAKREILDLNPVAEEILRVSRREAFMKRPEDIGVIPGEFGSLLGREDIAGDHPHFSVQYPIVRWFALSVRWVAKRFSSEGVYLVTIHDITKIVSLEKEVSDHKLRLLREQEHYRREMQYMVNFDSDQRAILLIERDRIIRCNQAAMQLIGRGWEELSGRSPVLFSSPVQKNPDDVPEKFGYLLLSAATGNPVSFSWVFRFGEEDLAGEVALRRVGGTERTIVEMIVRIPAAHTGGTAGS